MMALLHALAHTAPLPGLAQIKARGRGGRVGAVRRKRSAHWPIRGRGKGREQRSCPCQARWGGQTWTGCPCSPRRAEDRCPRGWCGDAQRREGRMSSCSRSRRGEPRRSYPTTVYGDGWPRRRTRLPIGHRKAQALARIALGVALRLGRGRGRG